MIVWHNVFVRLACLFFLCALGGVAHAQLTPPCTADNTVHAEVVALDQVVVMNRLGAVRPGGMIYALRTDVVSQDLNTPLVPGNVRLRDGKRPRPIVLRVNEGGCLDIALQNLLSPVATDPIAPVTRYVSIHASGMQVVNSIADDGTYVGANPMHDGNEDGIVAPGGRARYLLYAERQGSYLLYSTPANFNGFNTQQLTMGLFGAVNVEPKDAEWYRSQVSHADLLAASWLVEQPTPHYEINYDALYPGTSTPVLKMLDGNRNLVYSDLTAIITGPHHGVFTPSQDDPSFKPNPALPHREWPFREVTVHYHEAQDVVQPFPWSYNPQNATIPQTNAGADTFGINYGIAGIGNEILANRFGLGPARDCPECKFEEFFLSSWPGGDPAMIVDNPANLPCAVAQMEKAAAASGQGEVGLPLNPNVPPTIPGCSPGAAPKATKVFYPDDPSNVYHSYLGDHVRFQILHAGAAVHHVHHHHAHQWLHSPNSDESNYLDSQAIGPGGAFSLDLVYAGSGNRNLTAGDSIFHCHFYPHFASGMWALFRVHDVFEAGTELDADGRPAPGSRALPDGEIVTGTPIPAVVPLPTMAMAPLPEKVQIRNGQVEVLGPGHPGYPFFVPGIAGHRAPHPPLDFATDGDRGQLDGGLPRHIIQGAAVTNEQHTITDFSKDLGTISAVELPEEGTPTEVTAMKFFGQRKHPSFLPDRQEQADFIVNGLPRGPQHGAPFADPGVDDDGKPIGDGPDGKPRVYKGVNLQVNTIFNKKGWHFPQQRMMALWGDVQPILKGEKPPEPLFFRANSGDVVEYWHTNLVPGYYELDDFQVRTPTDILGQHIHLVKFDVLAADGAANGFNYEDGSFSPDEVRERIAGINAAGGLWPPDRGPQRKLTPKAIPELGPGLHGEWNGAQATVQRWWIDPLLNNQNKDRTFMTVFTHDHFGPSTHQMAGLYGGLLAEPRCSKWMSLDGKQTYGLRFDGGPTNFAANILPDPKCSDNEVEEPYREFALTWQDLQLVYQPTSKSQPDCYPGQDPLEANCVPVASGETYTGWADPANVINCPLCQVPGTTLAPGTAPLFATQSASGGVTAPVSPFPVLISDFGTGMFSLNYRSEPLPFRVSLPTGASQLNPSAGSSAADLSHAFRSIPRFDTQIGSQPQPGSQINPACSGPTCFKFPNDSMTIGALPEDPYTPLLRAYENDDVQIRTLVGAHTSMHDFTLHGLKWKFEPFEANSGYRNTQFSILSEHFEYPFTLPATAAKAKQADYLYNPSASYEGLVNGTWGLLRAYKHKVEDLAPLPNNPNPGERAAAMSAPPAEISSDCARQTPCLRKFNVSALTIGQALGKDQPLIYNARGANLGRDGNANPEFGKNPIYDPKALIYVRDEDLDERTGRLKPDVNLEPLVLRAAAGDWIQVKLTNRLDPHEPVFTQAQSGAKLGGSADYTNPYASFQLFASTSVGLHAQLVDFQVTSDDGMNVGTNPVQTVAPGDPPCANSKFPCRQYLWYAGNRKSNPDGSKTATPVEFGAINLLPADPLMHVFRGLFGGLIIEPCGSAWVEDTDYRASATVFPVNAPPFREFVLMAQNDIDLLINGNSMYALYTSGNNLSAANYRTEPFFYRFGAGMNSAIAMQGVPAPQDWGHLSAADLANINNMPMTALDTHLATANQLVGGDPLTPIFRAPAGMPVRYRMLNPGGIGDNQQVFELTGHVWQEEPFQNDSTVIGDNPKSQWTGTTTGYGATSHYNILVQAGGVNKVPGDYLYRSWTANQYEVGLWGLFRVGPAKCSAPADCPDTVTITSVSSSAYGGFEVKGVNTVSPQNRGFAKEVRITFNGSTDSATVDPQGRWTFHGTSSIPDFLTVTSADGGVAEYHSYQSQQKERLRMVQAPGTLETAQPQKRKLRTREPGSRP